MNEPFALRRALARAEAAKSLDAGEVEALPGARGQALDRKPGGCHFGSPDKDPDVWLRVLEDAKGDRAELPGQARHRDAFRARR